MLLRKIKHQGNYSDYWAKVKKIKTDIQVLTTTINNIDQHAINSKAFKNNTLFLLIKIRAVFVELENFYLNNLLTREFFNQDFFNCIHEIKQQLIAINYYIGSVNQEKLLTEFQQLISNLKLLYN